MEYNIMICTDNNYLYQTSVLIKSLIINNNDKLFDIYIVGNDLENKELNNLINRFNGENSINQINYINVGVKNLNVFQVSGHISAAAYYRILALDMLPESVDRVLYLDCDIIVNGDIKNLYNIDFNDDLIAAAEDVKISKKFKDVYENLQLDNNERYFNSGVILFNVGELRKIDGFENQLMNIAMDKNIVLRFHDQDVLNKYFYKKTKFIDDKLYNQVVKGIKNRKEADWVCSNSIIIHYADRRKPWKYNYVGYLDDEWWKYEILLNGKENYNEYKKKHIIYRYIPFGILRKIKRIFKKDI